MEYKIRVELKKVSMAKEIKLPEPKGKGSTSIEETLNKRRSVRDYKKGPLRLDQISHGQRGIRYVHMEVGHVGQYFPAGECLKLRGSDDRGL
jgi:hypothetical protein